MTNPKTVVAESSTTEFLETDLHIRITDEALARVQNHLGKAVTRSDVASDALTLFMWAAEQHAVGCKIVAYDASKGEATQCTLRSFAAELARRH